MLRYIGKRILIAIPTFLGITVLVYVLSSMAPGTPLEMIFNDPNATAEQMAAMKAKLGLDQPVSRNSRALWPVTRLPCRTQDGPACSPAIMISRAWSPAGATTPRRNPASVRPRHLA